MNYSTTAGQQQDVLMTKDNHANPLILVVEDVHEIRDGMEKLLKADGYRVSLARGEHDAMDNGRLKPPDLILVSLPGSPTEVGMVATRIRAGLQMGPEVPAVVFCGGGIGEGDEVAVGHNVHLTRPDNFNQLRSLLSRLLDKNLSASDSELGANAPEKNLAHHE
jgi:CheY-like chemotaxis protein